MNGVGSADVFNSAREAHKRNRSDVAVAVAIATDQGDFERLLGAENKQRSERSESRPREDARSEASPARADNRPQPHRGTARSPAADSPQPAPERAPKAPVKAEAGAQPSTTPPRGTVVANDARQTLPGQTGLEQILKHPAATQTAAAVRPTAPAVAAVPEKTPVAAKPANLAQQLGGPTVLVQGAKPAAVLMSQATAPAEAPVATSDQGASAADPAPAVQQPASGAAAQVREPQAHGPNPSGVDSSIYEAGQLARDGQAAPIDTGAQQFAETFQQVGALKATSEAAQPEAAAQLSQQVRTQIATQLAGKLGGLGGKGSLRLTLTPPELGRVEIRFTRNGTRLQLTFHVESAVAARALQDGAGHLQEMLLGGNSSWQQIDVTVEQDEDETDEQDMTDQEQTSQQDDDEQDALDPDEHGGER